jgi:hypothetical protein
VQDNFKEGQAVVLTLKDKGVLEEDDDVLVNVNIQDDERYRKVLANNQPMQLSLANPLMYCFALVAKDLQKHNLLVANCKK